jgi:hypothetical protein
MATKKYSFEKALAYYEAVTQIPHANRKLFAYTNRKHEPPNASITRNITYIPKITWYNNSWVNNSWVRNMMKADGGVPCFWTKDNTAISDPFSKSWKIYDEKFPDRGWRITYDVHDSIEKVLAQLLDFLEMHKDEKVVHVWIQGTLNGKDPKTVIKDLQRGLEFSSSGENGLFDNSIIDFVRGQRTSEYLELWHTPLEDSLDVWDYYGGKSPVRIPVIPWRVSNLGPRLYSRSIPPQLFPPTHFAKAMNITDVKLTLTEVYCNYSEFVEMVPINSDDALLLDFAWMPVGNNLYTMAKITEATKGHLLKVKDPDFFNGCGSVVTSAHACFGIGRSNIDLINQLERKLNTGHSTSGHMIASVLAFQSQFMWYLQEVFNNFEKGSSVYITKFAEPGSGMYHSIYEYRNAIHDMKTADKSKLYPNYARNNLDICEKFVSSLKL